MISRETLRVKNFAGIDSAEIDLSRMNIFIGPQASGKSVCAKLLFYFKEIVRRLAIDIEKENSKPKIRASHRDLFLKYFPLTTWSKSPFQIMYSYGALWVKVDRTNGESSVLDITYSEYYDALIFTGRKALKKAQSEADTDELIGQPLAQARISITNKMSQDIGRTLSNQNYFIPAGRSFFSTLRSSVFSFIAGDVGIDPFLAEFGRLYENIRRVYNTPSRQNVSRWKRINEHISTIICGTYRRSGSRDYIQTSDDRQVAIESSSSGQQEALPLALLLGRMGATPGGEVRSTFFVEEPEAHLYPIAQREIVHLLTASTDLSSESATSQYIITTHSPYILTALNNLMYGRIIATDYPRLRGRITKILGEATLIDPANVRAYAFGNGQVQSIIDEKTKLVKATVLDSVSNELAAEFEALVDIAFEEDAA